MSYRPWYNENVDYQTNAKSYMDYLGRVNKFMQVLLEDYEVFQEVIIEELERMRFNAEMEVEDILLNWLDDGTLERIINDEVFKNKADTDWVDNQLNQLRQDIQNDFSDLNNIIDDLEISIDDSMEQLKSEIDIEINDSYDLLNNKIEDFDFINLNDFDVKGDGITDDTLNIQNAFDLAYNENKTLFIPDGVYVCNNIEIKTPVLMGGYVEFKFNGLDGGSLLTINANNLKLPKITLDGNNLSCTLLRIYGDNNFIEHVTIKNLLMSNNSTKHCFGLYIKGNDNFIGYVSGTNLINGGYSNESFPQALGVEGNNNRFNVVKLENIASGLATINNDSSLDHLTFVSNLWIENASDNGIYNLPDTSIHINDMYYNGNEEPAVFTGNDIFIDSFRIKGNGSRIGFQNVNNVRINHLRIERDSEGKTVNALFRTRTGNILSGNISIGNISGEIVSDGLGQQLMLLNTGVIKYLTIENMDLVHIVKGSKDGLSSWIMLDVVQQLKFGEIKYKIIDDENSFTSNDKFEMLLPSLIKQSFIKSFEVQIVNNDGATISPAEFRGFRFKQQLLDIDGLRMQTNIGPYARESTIGEPNTMNAIPSAGYWKKGEIFYSRAITQTGTIGWVCVESGNPGVWRELN